MKHQDYLLKMKVGNALRTIKWNGFDSLSLDHPQGWILEPTDAGFRIFDGTQKNKEAQDLSAVEVTELTWQDHLHIELPPTNGNETRHLSVDMIRLQPIKPAYSPAVYNTVIVSKNKQLFLFYGLRYFLVHYRPIGSHDMITIGEHKIFHYERIPEGFKITPIREAIKLKIPGEKKRTLSVGQSYVISESTFFNSTFLLSVHWWRFQAVVTPDSLPPIETEESVDDVREALRLKKAIQAFGVSFLLLTIVMFLTAKKEPKIISQTQVELKQPKIIPLKEPPKIVEKKPDPPKPEPEKKIVEKKPKPEPQPKPEKKIAKIPKPPKPQKQLAKKAARPTPTPVAKVAPPPTPKAPLPPNAGVIAKKAPDLPPPPNPNVQLMKSLSFLGTSSSKPVAQIPSNYQGAKKFDPKAIAVGGGSKNSVLNDMVNVSSDSKINTQSSRSIASEINFGDSKGGGKGLNAVQGKVSSKDLYDPNTKFGSGFGGGGLSLSGPGSIAESEIEKALAKFMSKFQYCYEKALLSNPGLGGDIVFKWTIETNGRTKDPKVVNSAMKDAKLHSCIGDVLKQVPFPKPTGGTVGVTRTFKFSSASL